VRPFHRAWLQCYSDDKRARVNAIEDASTQAASTMRRRWGDISCPSFLGQG
jgi:hypothetical protein